MPLLIDNGCVVGHIHTPPAIRTIKKRQWQYFNCRICSKHTRHRLTVFAYAWYDSRWVWMCPCGFGNRKYKPRPKKEQKRA